MLLFPPSGVSFTPVFSRPAGEHDALRDVPSRPLTRRGLPLTFDCLPFAMPVFLSCLEAADMVPHGSVGVYPMSGAPIKVHPMLVPCFIFGIFGDIATGRFLSASSAEDNHIRFSLLCALRRHVGNCDPFQPLSRVIIFRA